MQTTDMAPTVTEVVRQIRGDIDWHTNPATALTPYGDGYVAGLRAALSIADPSVLLDGDRTDSDRIDESKRERELINRLFAKARHMPQFVVCADCEHGSGYTAIAHSSGFGEDSVCVWPCNHEVQPHEPRCLYCQPYTEAELNEPPF